MTSLPCPAVKELMSAINGSIPFLQGKYREVNKKMLPRLQWSADGSLNRHDAGLALDIILFNHVPKERVLAHHLMDVLLQNISEMRWQSAIYEKVVFSSTGIPKPYAKDGKHNTHIHIDWMIYELYLQSGKTKIPWSAEAYTVGFSARLAEQLKKLNDDWLNNKLSPIDLGKRKAASESYPTN